MKLKNGLLQLQVYDERLEFYMTWPQVLREQTSFHIGWSYIVAWVGIAVCLISSIMYSLAAICIKHQVNLVISQLGAVHSQVF